MIIIMIITSAVKNNSNKKITYTILLKESTRALDDFSLSDILFAEVFFSSEDSSSPTIKKG